MCQNVNVQSTWCAKCKARWNSTKEQPIYYERAASTTSLPATARSGAGARLALQEATAAGWPPRGRSNSRTRANMDKGGKNKGKGKDQDGKGKDNDRDKDKATGGGGGQQMTRRR